MKANYYSKKVFLLSLGMLMYFFSIAQLDTNGLVGYWPFDGDASDVSGNGSHGIVDGATLTFDRFNVANKAYSFDGNDKIDLANTESFLDGLTEITIALWAKLEGNNNSYAGIVYSRENVPNVLGISYGNLGPNQLRFDVNNGVQYITTHSDDNSLVDNTWHFVVATWKSNDKPRIYIDGQLAKESSSFSGSLNVISSLIVGSDASLNNRYFIGSIDEILMYNRALNSSEIFQLYTFFNTPPTPELCNMIYCDGGGVGIGTSIVPSNYTLAVDGKAIMEEVKVQLSENWPDYVFETDYELRTLEELEEHIAEKGHLPEIPSEAEVTYNGINLGEMDAKLLQKIEELTLYMIDMNKRVNQLEQENSKLKENNQELKNKVESLENK